MELQKVVMRMTIESQETTVGILFTLVRLEDPAELPFFIFVSGFHFVHMCIVQFSAILVPKSTGSICFDPSNTDISLAGTPSQVTSSAKVAPDNKGKVSSANEAFMGRTLSQYHKNQDTLTVSRFNPKAGLLVFKVESWKSFGWTFLLLIN